jgi:hypothetical protein
LAHCARMGIDPRPKERVRADVRVNVVEVLIALNVVSSFARKIECWKVSNGADLRHSSLAPNFWNGSIQAAA